MKEAVRGVSEREGVAHQLLKAGLLSRGQVKLDFCGSCMRPLLRDGDRVLIRPVSPNTLRRGDIITFMADGRLYTHRYIKRVNPGSGAARLITKGDRNPDLDRWRIAPDEVLGRVVSIEKKGKMLNLGTAAWRLSSLIMLTAAYMQICLPAGKIPFRARVTGAISTAASAFTHLALYATGERALQQARGRTTGKAG